MSENPKKIVRKTHVPAVDPANRFRTGNEWQPGRPNPRPRHKDDVDQPSETVKNTVEELLIGVFKHEQPPAYKISVIPGSLRLKDPTQGTWTASVHTTVHYRTIPARHHTSRVRFRVLQLPRSGDFSIQHNHVIFI